MHLRADTLADPTRDEPRVCNLPSVDELVDQQLALRRIVDFGVVHGVAVGSAEVDEDIAIYVSPLRAECL